MAHGKATISDSKMHVPSHASREPNVGLLDNIQLDWYLQAWNMWQRSTPPPYMTSTTGKVEWSDLLCEMLLRGRPNGPTVPK